MVPEAPAGSVDWYERAGEPTRAVLLAQQARALEVLLGCINSPALRASSPHAVSLVLAFEPSGAVGWTDRDALSSSVHHCIASEARRALRVPAFAGAHSVVVFFPLPGERW